MVRLFMLLLLIAPSSWAITYNDINIEQMINQADRVFVGNVVEQTTGVTDGTHYVQTTFDVVKWYGTGTQSTVTIKQLGKQQRDGSIRVFPGLPIFHAGGTYTLMLPDDSAKGFASPVGLLTFEMFAKSNEDIILNKSSVQAIPNRPVKGLFKDIERQSMKAIVDQNMPQGLVNKTNPLRFDAFDALLEAGVAP